MRIFATSDIHSNPHLLEKLVEISPEYDLILYCGDVCSGPSGEHRATAELENFISYLEKCDCPVKFIRGNCDNFITDSPFFLNSPEKINDVTITPFEHILTTPFGTFREQSEEHLAIELNLLETPANNIILAHNPPHGAGDKIGKDTHVGSHSITKWIKQKKPMFWLCGHVHEAFGKYKIDDTIVLNCASNAQSNLLRGWAFDTKTMKCTQIQHQQ